jgi:hypothetical protein
MGTMRSAENARKVVQQFSDLAQKLADENVVLRSLEISGGFGSWMIEVEDGAATDAYISVLEAANGPKEWPPRGPDVVRVSWDGRDRYLAVDLAATATLTSPGPWKRKLERTFEKPDDAFQFCQEHVVQWVREWAT